MRIAICDDKREQIEIIENAVKLYFDSRKEVFQDIHTFETAFDFLDAQEKKPYDIALLDICMPALLGTDLAREIRKRRDKTEIIFLTCSDEFAVDAFAVRAAHYLLKPFIQAEFNEAISRAINNIADKINYTVTFKCVGGTLENINKNSVVYIESSSHIQTIYLQDGLSLCATQTLTEIFNTFDALSPNQFIIPFKGYIINQNFISTIQSDKIILKGGKTIPIPRRSFREIKQNYFYYIFKGSDKE